MKNPPSLGLSTLSLLRKSIERCLPGLPKIGYSEHMLLVIKGGLLALALIGWFLTQKWIARRLPHEASMGDHVHEWTRSINGYLQRHARASTWLLISSSFVIDLLGLSVCYAGLFGPSVRPLVGMVILFALRQLCMGLVTLPVPEGMIWRHPGVPSIFVTYGTTTDMFFSGHTAIAVLGAIELSRTWGVSPVWGVMAALFEIGTVLVLRAHWTLDVFTGIVTALWVASISPSLSAPLDTWLHSLVNG